MYLKSKPFILLCEESLRAGTSVTSTTFGDIDNPIQRNPTTLFPIIEGSSYRGALRDSFTRKGVDEKIIKLLFGNRPNDVDQQRGTIRLSTLELLFFPIATPIGVQAYVTCPMVLENWNRMLEIGENEEYSISNIPMDFYFDQAIVSTQTSLRSGNLITKVVLGQDTFIVDDDISIENCTIEETPMNEWFGEKLFPNYPSFKRNFVQNVVIVSNDIFKMIVTHNTYIATGITINYQTRVVEDGMLFKTEYLPQFSVMQGQIGASPEFKATKGLSVDEIIQTFISSIEITLRGFVQIGGRSSIGKGISKITFWKPHKNIISDGNADS